MTNWLIGVGGIFVVAGALLLSPLTDFLPVRFYFWLKGQRLDGHSYFRATNEPDGAFSPFVFWGIAFLAVGALVLGCAWLLRGRV